MTMDASEVATVYLKSNTVIFQVSTSTLNIIISDDNDGINKMGNLSSSTIMMTAHYRYTFMNVGSAAKTFAITNFKTNESSTMVIGNRIIKSSTSVYEVKPQANVSLRNVNKAFFYDYAMTSDEMKEKITLIESLQI